MINTVTHGDAFALLPQLADASVDLVLTDPPYGTTACRWDDNLARKGRGQAESQLQVLFRELRRVVKPTGAVLVFAQQPFATDCINAWRQGFRYEWVWHKPIATGFLNANRAPLRSHELVLVFYHKQPYWHWRHEWHGRPTTPVEGKDYIYQRRGHDRRQAKLGKPRDVLAYAQDKRQRDPFRHPTRKPEALVRFLIETYTRPGELVLDPFAGSGTTAAAAVATGRAFATFERDPEYAQVARDRVAAAGLPHAD